MALLLLVIGWVGYVAWVMRASESSRRMHLVAAWSALVLVALIDLASLLR